MNKITLLLLSSAAIIAFSFTGATFEGKITYEVNMEGANMPPEAQAMFAGSELTIYIKNSKSRSDINMGMQKTTTISDTKTNTTVTLMEMMGSKYKILSDPKKEEKTEDIKVKYLDDTKTIAGYKCKKAELSFKDDTGKQQATTIWYSEEITNHLGQSNRNKQFRGIKGMPLEYEMSGDRGMTMKMTAKTVSKENVPDSKFEVPSGYKETTLEDLQKEMMKGMMQGGDH
jgi:GLPGLI family protein